MDHDEAPRPYPITEPRPDLPALEARVLERWAADDTFQRSIDERPLDDEYVFYDGPPFANGLPHYGHLLTGYVKDIVPRYQTMRGRRVERRFGWDCHGLPGRDGGREGARGLGPQADHRVRHRAASTTTAVDRCCATPASGSATSPARPAGSTSSNDYKTMDLSYMESVMWAFKQLWDKGLLYEGLPGHALLVGGRDAALELRDPPRRRHPPRQDPAITVRFPLEPEPATTGAADICSSGPRRRGRCRRTWRSPSGPTSTTPSSSSTVRTYVLGRRHAGRATTPELGDAEPGRHRARARSSSAAATSRSFPFFAGTANAFRVLAADFVDTEEGTGVVHMAPGFGEDDQTVCEANGIPLVCPVDDAGTFTAEVPDWQGVQRLRGQHPIIRDLKERGVLVRHETYVHNYPHCWRTDTPLIYKAVDSWYVRVTDVPRPHGRAQPADQLDPRARPRRAVRQVARGRPRLVDQPQPLLGLADPGLEERRPALPAHRRLRQPRRARSATSACARRPAPPADRRAGAAQPRRPDRQEP